MTLTRTLVFRILVPVCATVLAILGAEFFFRHVLLEPRVPDSMAAFETAVSSAWPRPVRPEKTPGTFRVLMLGDSFGRHGEDRNFCYQLEDALRQEHPAVELVNLSVRGLETHDELELLRRFGARYQPDLVIHGFFIGNDFHLPPGELVSYRGVVLRRMSGLESYRPQRLLIWQWWKRFRRARAARAASDREALAMADTNATRTVVFSESGFLAMEHARLQMCQDTPQRRRNFRPAKRLLNAFHAETESLGARYMLLIHPDQYQVEDALLNQLARTYNLHLPNYQLAAPQASLTVHTHHLGIPCLDLLPGFRARGRDGGLYLVRNTHYSDEGNSLAARLLYEFLHDEQLVPWPRGEEPEARSASPG